MFDAEWKLEKTDRHLLAAQIAPFGVSFLDDALVGIFPNDLILVGARTGRGKTEFATTVSYNASKASRRVAFFALEADKWEIHRRMKYRKLSAYYEANYCGSALKWPRYSEWLAQGYNAEWDAIECLAEQDLAADTAELKIIYSNERYTVDRFEKDFESVAKDADLIIIDHLHYFDLGEREHEGLRHAIHVIRDKALHVGKPVILIAHLRKGDKLATDSLPTLDDFHGHSDLVKVATNVILMAPAPEEQVKGLGVFPTYFHIAKSRRASENLPWVAVLAFDRANNTYAKQYVLARHRGKELPEVAVGDAIPQWFKCARRTYYAL